MRPPQEFLYFRKEMVVTCVWVVGWMCYGMPSKSFEEIDCYTGDVWTSVVLMDTHSFFEYASPLVLSRTAKAVQRLTVPICIDYSTSKHEFAHPITPFCPKSCSPALCRQKVFA
ncbi:hypothetical protein Trydic_g16612 [Trypoxylus dichotomus]